LPILNTINYLLDPVKIIYRLFLEGQIDPLGSVEIYQSVFVGPVCEWRFLVLKGSTKRRRTRTGGRAEDIVVSDVSMGNAEIG
jgi:hypothetical protein